MTLEERAAHLATHYAAIGLVAPAAKAILAALREVREQSLEESAKVADRLARYIHPDITNRDQRMTIEETAKYIAAAIREEGKKP